MRENMEKLFHMFHSWLNSSSEEEVFNKKNDLAYLGDFLKKA